MEIEPHIVEVAVLHLCVHPCKLITDSLLRTLLVDQVDEVLWTVHAFCFFEMKLCC